MVRISGGAQKDIGDATTSSGVSKWAAFFGSPPTVDTTREDKKQIQSSASSSTKKTVASTPTEEREPSESGRGLSQRSSIALRKPLQVTTSSPGQSGVEWRNFDSNAPKSSKSRIAKITVLAGKSKQSSFVRPHNGEQSIPSKPKVESKNRPAIGRVKNSVKLFQVRITPGFLTGVISTEKRSKKKKSNANKAVVVGYASVASSPRFALSQPLTPRFNQEPVVRHNLVWPKTDGEFTADMTKERRRLYFQLPLKEESEDKVLVKSANCKYVPEVVKIVVGVKCGEHVLPLGVANIVVNGEYVSEQTLDLAVQPVANNQDFDFARKTQRWGFLGSKKQAKSFPNDEHTYELAENSTFRVRLDVQEDTQQAVGPSLWGDINDDSESFASKINLCDLGSPDGQDMVRRRRIPLNDCETVSRQEFIEVLPGNKGTTIIFSPGGSAHKRTGQRRGFGSLPVISVPGVGNPPSFFHSKSFSEEAHFWEDDLCGARCNVDDDANTLKCFSYEGERSDNIYHNVSALTGTTTGEGTHTTVDPRSSIREDDSFDSSVFDFTALGNSTLEHPNAGQSFTTGSLLTMGTFNGQSHAAFSLDTCDDHTYDEVKHARRTLVRYARKAGVDVDDLLELRNKRMTRHDSWSDSSYSSLESESSG